MLLIVGASQRLFDDFIGQTAMVAGDNAFKEGAGAKRSRRNFWALTSQTDLHFIPEIGLLPHTQHVNGEARPATWSRGHVDSMLQDPNGLPDYEKADSETLAPLGIKTGERIEDLRDPLARNTDSSVVHVDANARTEAPAADKDAPTRLGISDRVADQIPQGRTQQKVIAHDPIVTRYHSHTNPFA